MSSKIAKYDVIIVGAGAAGLACARALQKQKLNFLILEARDRIGGRAWTESTSINVIEYGPEFIHGAQKPTLDLLKKYDVPFVQLSDNHLFLKDKKLKELPDFWDKIDKVSALMNADLAVDRSLQDFLNAHKSKVTQELRDVFVSFVEGFEAADLNLAGERALAVAENEDEPMINTESQFRPALGYSHFMGLLKTDAGFTEDRLHLEQEVQSIHWSKSMTQLQVLDKVKERHYEVASKVLILTIPVSLLKERIRFFPEIPALKKALTTVHMGHVQRITFRFADEFWTSLSKKPVSFLHSTSNYYFPTWWTQSPIHNSLLTAWQGGPKAADMMSWTDEQKVEMAFKTLSILTGKSLNYLRKNCLSYYTHNWSTDPYSSGAYAFTGIQNEETVDRLRKAFAHRIFIAGEATAPGSAQGTVHGALESGERAARQAIAALKKR